MIVDNQLYTESHFVYSHGTFEFWCIDTSDA